MVHRTGLVAAIRCGGKILRETFQDSESLVKLPFGSEYEILLKNVDTRNVSVKIWVDGQEACDGSIIVPPNSSTHLEGFLKEYSVRNKFKFIRKTEEISNYRGDRIDDGLIRIEYCFEARKAEIIHDYHYHHDYWYPYHWYYAPHYGTYNINYSNSIGVRGSIGPSGDTGKPSDLSECSVNAFNCSVSEPQNSSYDQGITVPGSRSDQQFMPTTIGQLESNSYAIIIRLVGEKAGKKIEKPVFTKTKLNCPTCGRKSKSDAAFCRNCGTALS